ncbi:hypothetical protein Hanom_Chr07g00605521 [Helianthus anomalus]
MSELYLCTPPSTSPTHHLPLPLTHHANNVELIVDAIQPKKTLNQKQINTQSKSK